ncbi:MAG: hypothetical protein V7704_20720 [Aurantimonas endophytica]|uniref:hypothetical protein n=1 Tax=Aurantimonas endophytica TaxID=1522175 RepID=UPI00300241CC
MTVIKAAAILTLWRDGRFDTMDIAQALTVHEADVVRVIDAARERARCTVPLQVV